MREMGTVVRFRSTFGFIAPDSGGKDVFVHFEAIEGLGRRTLTPGEGVSFERGEDAQGRPCALAVRHEDGEVL
jgi:CspA family cold shock protein